MIKTTENGSEYKLAYDGLYRWESRVARVPEALKGGFSNQIEALDVFNRYNNSLSIKATTVDADAELNELNTKAELLGYAEQNGIEIPEKYKQVGSIKKFLQGGYN